MYKAIVVEDEQRPRAVLLEKIQQYTPNIEVVEACEYASAALIAILKHSPDLLFLDIHLKGKDGFWLIGELRKATIFPYIIFITSHADKDYMQEAIRMDSVVDYIFKPVDPAELMLAVKHCTEKIEEARKDAAFLDASFFRHPGKNFSRIPFESISCIQSDSECSIIHLISGESRKVFESLKSINSKKLPGYFVRLDRQYIINVRAIKKIDLKERICLLNMQFEDLCIFPSTEGIKILKEIMKKHP